MGALVAADGGCLVLSDPDFRGQNDCVPFFVTLEADPPVKARPRIERAEFRASVPMQTCALTKDYEARIFVDGNPVRFQKVPPTGGELRNVPVIVDVSLLSPGCHFVEVFVSSNFLATGSDFTKPARGGDIAYIVWTFLNDSDASALCGGS